jgi:rubrerythrin
MNTLLEYLIVPQEQRGISWLQDAVQKAIELELATIPPYLTAMWSIKDPDHAVAATLADIAMQEMGHMGLACNILNAIQPLPGSPRVCPVIASSKVVPQYPAPLPGNVNPDLMIPLEKISRALVKNVFMEIERPEYAPLSFRDDGPPYPSIGAFYDAISDAILQLDPGQIAGTRQRQAPQVGVTPVVTQLDALRAISLIKKQGEGTAIGPYFDPGHPDEATLAHYYRFAEIYRGRSITIKHWQVVYDGAKVPFPKKGELHPMAPVPKGGYKTKDALAFNVAFSDMLRNLQDAWELDDDNLARIRLKAAINDMQKLTPIACQLMTTKISPSSPATYGPAFIFCP